jgi:hypothetical protein
MAMTLDRATNHDDDDVAVAVTVAVAVLMQVTTDNSCNDFYHDL